LELQNWSPFAGMPKWAEACCHVSRMAWRPLHGHTLSAMEIIIF
jgi:hypothetical protein